MRFLLVLMLAAHVHAAALPESCKLPDQPEPDASAPEMVACDAGGLGASSCESRTTINVGGWGATEGCGISCADGYYACCQNASLGQTAVCSCVSNPRRRSYFKWPEW